MRYEEIEDERIVALENIVYDMPAARLRDIDTNHDRRDHPS
jgi:hypothetical protein